MEHSFSVRDMEQMYHGMLENSTKSWRVEIQQRGIKHCLFLYKSKLNAVDSFRKLVMLSLSSINALFNNPCVVTTCSFTFIPLL